MTVRISKSSTVVYACNYFSTSYCVTVWTRAPLAAVKSFLQPNLKVMVKKKNKTENNQIALLSHTQAIKPAQFFFYQTGFK